MIFDRIVQVCIPGVIIPKPRARSEFRVKGLGTRRGEKALIYNIPNNKNPDRPYEKGITVSEFEKAYLELMKSGEITKQWFDKHLPGCSAEGSCNFTTIGGIFQLIGEAKYTGSGIYNRITHGE